ncbi:MAG TPA: hypothetical protein VE077_09060 [Candidatus Methylomirabilis sp.]|nr:hypothetical protein [Candidatus Methylomirabilis sp.]
MGLLFRKRTACRDFRAQLESAAGAAGRAKDISALLVASPALREHSSACADCRAAAEDILASRALLAAIPSSAAQAGPWFAPRVMAAIAARTAELSRAADTWTFLPKLAARLTWASSVALLLASGWLFQRPHPNPPATVATDITGEPVVENPSPATDDDLLFSLAERENPKR